MLFRLHPPHQKYLRGLTEAARQATQKGNVVLVGRGARHLLAEMPDVFHLRLVAPPEWRTQRMARLEGWSPDEARARCLEMDRVRDLFTRYFFGETATQPPQYDLVVNTSRVPLEDVASTVSAIVRPVTGKRDGPHLPERPGGCFAQKETVPFSGLTTLLMSTGLTFGTISALFGLNKGYINEDQYSVLVTVVIASAVVPTMITQAFFRPRVESAVEFTIGPNAYPNSSSAGGDSSPSDQPLPDTKEPQ